MKPSSASAWLAGLALLSLLGCNQAQEDKAAQQAAQAVHGANQALREAKTVAREGATEALAAAREGAGQVAQAAREGSRDAGRVLGDAALTAKVKTALLADKEVNGSDIDVDTKLGVVTLRGRLSDQAQIERALAVARAVDGVKSVDNQLSAAG
ncbi:MAG: BON domain-containing protein [Burkholderiales bacterium]|nr:BON domain-containing protein [Burkholderiales bacterium]